MLRMFETHEVRPLRELSSRLWDFATMSRDGESVRMKVTVPSCWENYPGTRTYRGRADYERCFRASGNIRLEFRGVSHTGEVFVDGERVAAHYNAYTPFSAVIKNLSPGFHRLRVHEQSGDACRDIYLSEKARNGYRAAGAREQARDICPSEQAGNGCRTAGASPPASCSAPSKRLSCPSTFLDFSLDVPKSFFRFFAVFSRSFTKCFSELFSHIGIVRKAAAVTDFRNGKIGSF